MIKRVKPIATERTTMFSHNTLFRSGQPQHVMNSRLIGALAVLATLFLVSAPVPTLAQSPEPWLTKALDL